MIMISCENNVTHHWSSDVAICCKRYNIWSSSEINFIEKKQREREALILAKDIEEEENPNYAQLLVFKLREER